MKLHLGCGKKLWPGFVNVDAVGDPDVKCDLRKLPFDSNSADEIHSVHVVEHLYVHEVLDVMTEWVRVLKPGGLMVVEVPCRDKVFDLIKRGETRHQLVVWPFCSQPDNVFSEYDLHKWCYSFDEMGRLLDAAGLGSIRFEEPKFHVPFRDMRAVGVKRGDQ